MSKMTKLVSFAQAPSRITSCPSRADVTTSESDDSIIMKLRLRVRHLILDIFGGVIILLVLVINPQQRCFTSRSVSVMIISINDKPISLEIYHMCNCNIQTLEMASLFIKNANLQPTTQSHLLILIEWDII